MTRQELITYYTAVFQGIYGPDIDLTSSSPDGQLIGILVQNILDLQDLLVQIYNSFDPDNAVGTQLDQRVTINGIQRQAGTYTITPITITTDRALNLFGLDQTAQPVFTVADNTGNQWELIATENVPGAGSASYQFRAANPGRTLTVPNTIKNAVTVVLGVTAINNPSGPTSLGDNEETDAALKIRRQKSTQLPAQGFIDALEAALGNIVGVTYERVYENKGDIINADGVPPHCIWAILGGNGAPADIANAIYVERTEGCNMKGSQTFNVTQKDLSLITIRWDNVAAENIYIKFTATSIDGVNPPNLQQILEQLPSLFVPGIGAEVNINQLATLVQQIDPNTLVTDAGFSTAPTGPFTETLAPTAKNFQFVATTPNIYILDVVLLPVETSVARLTTQQFNAYGGSQTGYVFSMTANPSGGSIDAGTGLYTAGATPATDTVRVLDSDGNAAFATVTVT